MTGETTDHAPTPWPDEATVIEAWRAVAAEQRGGSGYGPLIAAFRLLQDRISGAVLPDDLVPVVAAKLTELDDLLADHQAPEHERWDGLRPDLPGRGSPLLPPFVIDEAERGHQRGRVTFTRFHLGGGGALHGGIHGLLFDDLMGSMVSRTGAICRTAYLTINYRRITPLDVELAWDISLDSVDGRKHFVTGRLYNPDGDLVSDVDGLFVRLLPGQP